MFSRKLHNTTLAIMALGFFFYIAACQNEPDEENANTARPATVNFWNVSSFKVDIYKNLNPDFFDPTALVCTVNAGSTATVTMFPSADQMIGDVFYPRYKVLLADRLTSGTTDIHIDAQRNLSNISFVVESGQTYTRTIPQPLTGELRFVNGYIAVQNMAATPVQIRHGNEVLRTLDNQGIYINPGSNPGYYEIAIPWHLETRTVSQLTAFSSSEMPFPEFEMERGRLYRFSVGNSGIEGPTITPINPIP